MNKLIIRRVTVANTNALTPLFDGYHLVIPATVAKDGNDATD